MRISGFTMCKNAEKLYYPIQAVIRSILPIVDEFVVALGDCDPDDSTRREIEQIGSDKIKIIDTVWDIKSYPNGMENAHQTDIAKEACTGDWLFYLQADEAVHEKYHGEIVRACEKHLDDLQVEGFLFKYLHFWGDYQHYNNFHGWYPREIRIIRNNPDIHSFQSAQSFRRIPDFDGKSYRKKEGTYKLRVKEIEAYIYHYGWVRPPRLMQSKTKALDTIHKGKKGADALFRGKSLDFDYGSLALLPEFRGSHPKPMKDFILDFHWQDQLHYEKNYKPARPPVKHEKFKSRFLTFIEQRLLGGRTILGYSNWKKI
jgi:hypothetical protein